MWALAVPLGIASSLVHKKKSEIGKYPSGNVPRMAILLTVLVDELQSNKTYLTSLIRLIMLFQLWGSLPPKLILS